MTTATPAHLGKTSPADLGSGSAAVIVDGVEYFPYTQDDYDFIDEVTAESDPVHYKSSPSLIPLKTRMKGWDHAGAELLNQSYGFPWSCPVGGLAQDELAALLDDIVMKIEADGYMRHRDDYCSYSLAMNMLGLQAPAFRPLPPIPWKAQDQKPEHMVIQRDRISIDCHWLYATKSKVYAQEGKWRGLVDAKKPLQCARIEAFAATKMSNYYRAGSALNLHDAQQVQLAAIRDAKMREAFQNLGALVRGPGGTRTAARFKKIERQIGGWCARQPRFEKHYGKYRAFALVCELLDSPTVAQAVKLAGLILGEPPLSESTARQTLKTLNERILRPAAT